MSARGATFRIAGRKFGPFEQAIRRQWEAFEIEAGSGLALEIVALELHDLEEALFTSGGVRDGAWAFWVLVTDGMSEMHERGCAVDVAPLLSSEPPQDYPEGWSAS